MTNKTNAEIYHFIRGHIDVDNLSLIASELSVLRRVTIQMSGRNIGVYKVKFWKNHDE